MIDYKVTAQPLNFPLFVEANTEAEAWEIAKARAAANEITLYNGKVEEMPTREDLMNRINELEAALGLAEKYLTHPDVKSIPFAYPVETVAERVRALLERTDG